MADIVFDSQQNSYSSSNQTSLKNQLDSTWMCKAKNYFHQKPRVPYRKARIDNNFQALIIIKLFQKSFPPIRIK